MAKNIQNNGLNTSLKKSIMPDSRQQSTPNKPFAVVDVGSTETSIAILDIEEITVDELRTELEQLKENGIDFLVDDLESVQEQFLDWQKRFVDKTHDFCYYCKWGPPTEH